MRADGEVVLLAPDGTTERARFVLQRCLPVKLKAPPLNAKDGMVAIEELQLAYESLTLKRPSGGSRCLSRLEPRAGRAARARRDVRRTRSTRTRWVTVQFNPETLKVTFANQIVQGSGAGDQRGSPARQFVGAGTTKLSLQLWFDVTAYPAGTARRTTCAS